MLGQGPPPAHPKSKGLGNLRGLSKHPRRLSSWSRRGMRQPQSGVGWRGAVRVFAWCYSGVGGGFLALRWTVFALRLAELGAAERQGGGRVGRIATSGGVGQRSHLTLQRKGEASNRRARSQGTAGQLLVVCTLRQVRLDTVPHTTSLADRPHLPIAYRRLKWPPNSPVPLSESLGPRKASRSAAGWRNPLGTAPLTLNLSLLPQAVRVPESCC